MASNWYHLSSTDVNLIYLDWLTEKLFYATFGKWKEVIFGAALGKFSDVNSIITSFTSISSVICLPLHLVVVAFNIKPLYTCLIISVTKLTPPLFIEMTVPNQKNELWCICMLKYRFCLGFFKKSTFPSFVSIEYAISMRYKLMKYLWFVQ